MYIGLHIKYPLFVSILTKLEFSRHILEKKKQVKISNFKNIRLVEVELYHAERRKDIRTDRYDENDSRFTRFLKMRLKKLYFRCYTVHVVELLNYYTNYCTYIKFIKFTH